MKSSSREKPVSEEKSAEVFEETEFGVESDEVQIEKESTLEILDHVAQRTLELENFANSIYSEYGPEMVTVAGVEIDTNNLDIEAKEKLAALKDRVIEVLQQTAHAALRITKRAVIVGALSATLLTTYTAVDLNKQGKFSDKEKARSELESEGIPSDQRFSAYKPGVSELLYRGVRPWGYQETTAKRESDFMPGVFRFLEEQGVPNVGVVQEVIPNIIHGRNSPEDKYTPREDAWKLYLGLPQVNNTFGISEYKPSEGKEDKCYFKINDFWKRITKYGFVGMDFAKMNNRIEQEGKAIVAEHGRENDIMGNFVLGKGKDEKGSYVYYYDKWDLDSPLVENVIVKGVGKAYEIYDRLYYDPVTLMPISN